MVKKTLKKRGKIIYAKSRRIRKQRKAKAKAKRKSVGTAKRKSGGTVTPLEVYYDTTLIKNNEDLTGKSFLYNQIPSIKYSSSDEKTFLITMTDPDAPSGVLWPHYVITIKNNTIEKIVYPYHPPTPPPNTGVHHYIFNAYIYNKEEDEAKLNNKENLTGDAYYKQVLEPVIKNKGSYAKIQFTLKA